MPVVWALIGAGLFNHLGPSGGTVRFGRNRPATRGGRHAGADSDEVRLLSSTRAAMDARLPPTACGWTPCMHWWTHNPRGAPARPAGCQASCGPRHPLSLIAKPLNDPRLITRPSHGGHGITAVETDDSHHAIQPVSGERRRATMQISARTRVRAAQRLLHAGTYSSFPARRRRRRALDTSASRPPEAARHHRRQSRAAALSAPIAIRWPARGKAALTSPYTAMLFMGERWRPPAVSVLLLTSRTGTGPRHRGRTRKEEFAEWLGRGRHSGPAGPADIPAAS